MYIVSIQLHFLYFFPTFNKHIRNLFFIQEKTIQTGESTRSPAKITAITEEEAVMRIGAVRKILFCTEELRTSLEDKFPVEGIAEYTEDTLIAFTPNPDIE